MAIMSIGFEGACGVLPALLCRQLLLRCETSDSLSDCFQWRADGGALCLGIRVRTHLGSRLRKVDIGWWLGKLAGRLEQARLQLDNVFTQGVVLRLVLFVGQFYFAVFAHLLLELLDITLLALTECSLKTLY